MPYDNRSELPDSVRNNLPAHAQSIYLSAFNNAWKEYEEPAERRNDRDREETAHAVAWSAVKQSYRKDSSGAWVEKTEH